MIIDGNIITAEEGKLLIRKKDNYVLGNSARLAYTYYLSGKHLETPILEKPEDYTEIAQSELEGRINIAGMYWPAIEGDYATLVDYLIKIAYSPEDQIAILCNYQLSPTNDKYLREYNEMQDWRKLCKETAKNYLNPQEDEVQ